MGLVVALIELLGGIAILVGLSTLVYMVIKILKELKNNKK
jgi:hypothetical protein